MIVFLPQPPNGPDQPFFLQMGETIRRAFMGVVSQNEAAQRIMLRSPDGSVYEVTVDNTGTLQTALQDGKSRI